MIGIMSWPRQTQHLKYVYRYVGGCDSWQQADNSNILLIINDGEWAVYGAEWTSAVSTARAAWR